MHLIILIPSISVLTIHVHITSFASLLPSTSSCVLCSCSCMCLNINFDSHYSSQALCPLLNSVPHNLHPGTLAPLWPFTLQSTLIILSSFFTQFNTTPNCQTLTSTLSEH